MEKLVINTDTRKLATISLSFVLIAVVAVALGFSQQSNPFLMVVCCALAIAPLAGAVSNIKKIRAAAPLFEFTADGVTDLTKPEDVITLPWDQVMGVQLKAANSNDLMLDIMGYKTADQHDVVTPEMRAQMAANNSDRVYYALELSGLWVRRSRVKEAFEWIRENVVPAHPQIVVGELEDPLSKLGKKKEQ